MANTRFDQISAIALEAMYVRGYEATTLRDIAREVGMQAASLYNYFSSKQELLYRVMHSVMEDLLEETRRAVAASEPAPDQRLHAAVRAFITFNLHHPHEAAVSDVEFRALTPENRERIVRLRNIFQGIFDPLIEEGIEQGIFAPTDVGIARNTILTACARTYLWYRPDRPRKREEVATIMADYLVRGLLI